uniref:DOMON domain-containing protein n=1 Tax=Steinernema glaseri TaxID=37863 RepID=A0A1I7YDK1_9BILA
MWQKGSDFVVWDESTSYVIPANNDARSAMTFSLGLQDNELGKIRKARNNDLTTSPIPGAADVRTDENSTMTHPIFGISAYGMTAETRIIIGASVALGGMLLIVGCFWCLIHIMVRSTRDGNTNTVEFTLATTQSEGVFDSKAAGSDCPKNAKTLQKTLDSTQKTFLSKEKNSSNTETSNKPLRRAKPKGISTYGLEASTMTNVVSRIPSTYSDVDDQYESLQVLASIAPPPS